MSFSDIANRFKKHAEAEEAAKPAEKPMDFNELHKIRGRIIGVLIRDARVAKGYTLGQLADQIQISGDTLIAWELGDQSPGLPQIELLGYILEVPVSHFLDGTDTMTDQISQRMVNPAEYTRTRDGMIGTLVRLAQQQANFTTEYLAQQCGIDPPVLTQYQYGQVSIPLPHLTTIARALRVNPSFFLESEDRVGRYLEAQELFNTFLEMDPEMRQFLSKPSNHRYVELAMKLAEMDINKLRFIAEGILEITY